MTNPTQHTFSGFQDSDGQFIPVPESFFTQVLPIMTNPDPLRLLLCLFRLFDQQEPKTGYLQDEDIFSNPLISNLLGGPESINAALNVLLNENILLKAEAKKSGRIYYLLNHQQAREAIKSIESGNWQESEIPQPNFQSEIEKPNIFKLYEENIGAITPMMAEILKEDEKTYPHSWFEDAIRIAVTRNARNWKYVQAILDRWQKEGRGNEQNRRDDSQDPDSYRESWLGRK